MSSLLEGIPALGNQSGRSEGFVWQFIFVAGMPVIGEKLHMAFLQVPWLGREETAFWGTGYRVCLAEAGVCDGHYDILRRIQFQESAESNSKNPY